MSTQYRTIPTVHKHHHTHKHTVGLYPQYKQCNCHKCTMRTVGLVREKKVDGNLSQNSLQRDDQICTSGKNHQILLRVMFMKTGRRKRICRITPATLNKEIGGNTLSYLISESNLIHLNLDLKTWCASI